MNPPQSQVPGPSGNSAEDEAEAGGVSNTLRQLGPSHVVPTPAAPDLSPGLEGPDRVVGAVIDGEYHITERIATSAMSRVYRAHQPALNREVALKLLHARDAAADVEMYRKRFDREAASLARLNHPNIVRVFDHGTYAGMPYLVMEFIHGQTLREYCGGRALSPTLAIEIIDQLALALGEAHHNELVHRDVKPANVFVEGEDADQLLVRLVDFGIAKDATDASEITGVDSVLGTPWYMAPEQAMGDPVDGRTDIYALGVLMYRLLVGCTPFSHLRGAAVLVAHINTPVPTFASVLKQRNSHLPPALEWTVRRCLEKSSSARFRDVEELRRALQICRQALVQPDRNFGMVLRQGALKFANQDIDLVPPSATTGHTLPSEPAITPLPAWAWLVPAALLAALIALWMPSSSARLPAPPPINDMPSAEALAAATPVELDDLSIALDEKGLWVTGVLSDSADAPVGRLEQHDQQVRYVLVLNRVDNPRMPNHIPLDGTLASTISLKDTVAGLEVTVESGTQPWGAPSLRSTSQGFKLHIPNAP
jgi:serine/threonine protein kinase